MNNLAFYLARAHSARRRMMFISTGVGASVGALAQIVLGVSFTTAIVVCVLATGLVEIVGAFSYVEPDRKARSAVVFLPSRRDLVRAGLSTAALLLLLSAWRIPRAAASVLEKRLLQASRDPTNPQSSKDAVRILASAQAAKIDISAGAVESAGKRFLNVGSDNRGAWEAAMACVNFRSFVNANSAATPKEGFRPVSGGLDWHLTLDWVPRPGAPEDEQVEWLGLVPADRAAVVEKLGDDLNPGAKFGPQYLRTHGIVLQLDGFRLKHVILTNCEIYYNDGPTQLEDVYFVNCRIHMSDDPAGGRRLADAILTGSSTNFTNPA